MNKILNSFKKFTPSDYERYNAIESFSLNQDSLLHERYFDLFCNVKTVRLDPNRQRLYGDFQSFFVWACKHSKKKQWIDLERIQNISQCGMCPKTGSLIYRISIFLNL